MDLNQAIRIVSLPFVTAVFTTFVKCMRVASYRAKANGNFARYSGTIGFIHYHEVRNFENDLQQPTKRVVSSRVCKIKYLDYGKKWPKIVLFCPMS